MLIKTEDNTFSYFYHFRLGLSDEKVKILQSHKNEKNKYESLDDLITLNVMQANELGNLCSNLTMKIVKKPRNVVSPAIGKKKLEVIHVDHKLFGNTLTPLFFLII